MIKEGPVNSTGGTATTRLELRSCLAFDLFGPQPGRQAENHIVEKETRSADWRPKGLCDQWWEWGVMVSAAF